MKRPTRKVTGQEEPTSNGGFSFGSTGSFADNDEFVSKDLAFDILAIAFEPGRGYEGGDRWAITVKVSDRDCEVMTLGANAKRNEQLREAQAHLERGGSIKNARLRRVKNAYYFTSGGR